MSSAALYCPRPPIPWPSLPPADPAAIWDNVLISVTSATGQLFIYFTIRKFGPVAFTIIMTTRQVGRTARGVASCVARVPATAVHRPAAHACTPRAPSPRAHPAQVFSMVLSTLSFGHALGAPGAVGSIIVFAALFYRIRRGGGGG